MKKMFVSSTFMDMQLERDSLKKRIVPDLNMRLREYGTKISQTDLRWGISTADMSAEEGEQKVLNVCLDEIDKSRPYMIVMIGQRYGWTPSTALIEMNARGHGIPLSDPNISVTQLEIEYIAFTEKWDESRIFFYFRDFDLGDMDPLQRKAYESESPEAAQKLQALKSRIEKKFPTQIRHYALRYENGNIYGIEQFEKQVTEDLYDLFCREQQEEEKVDVNIRVRDKQHAEAMENFAAYDHHYDVGRNRGRRLTCTDLTSAEKLHHYIAGSPRCGKTMSVQARYAAFYAWKHRESSCWKKAESLFRKSSGFHEGDGPFRYLNGLVDPEKTFPLYLQLGGNRDIKDETAFLRTLLYYLNAQLDLQETLPETADALLERLCLRLRQFSESDRYFYLFLDDLTPQALRCLFRIEHAFPEGEMEKLLEHFFFYISFSHQFSRVPSYVPFYEHCDISVEQKEIYSPADYFMAYARKMGKELSPGVVKYIIGYYGGYGETFKDAEMTHITRPHANLMANYFMNFTAEDYRCIKEMGNDMNAIEARQLQMLAAVRGNWRDDYHGISLQKVAVLNLEKFEPGHSETTLKMLGILYILAGMSFSMEEAEQMYGCFGAEWSDLAYISYFDDFKEFFLYHKESDSYRIQPIFRGALRRHFVEKHLPDGQEMRDAIRKLITATQSLPFYGQKRAELFQAVLLVPEESFVRECFALLFAEGADDYALGKAMGESVAQLMKQFSAEETAQLGATLAPILASHFSCDAVNGFFDGIGSGFQDHQYEQNVMQLAQALAAGVPQAQNLVCATCHLSIAMLKAYCYLGWKNNKVLDILFAAEHWVPMAAAEKQVRYLSILAGLLRRFVKDSPVFTRISGILLQHLPPMQPQNDLCDRALAHRADLFTLAHFVRSFAVAEDFYDPEQLLEPFLDPQYFCKMGLCNIEAAIYAQDGNVLGMDVLVDRTRMFMECLSAGFPDSRYAGRLINMCLLSRMFFVPEDPVLLEKYYYPYQKAVMWSNDASAYHYISYGLFLQNSRYFHWKTGISRIRDESMWQATAMGRWPSLFTTPGEESIDVMLYVCWSYVVFLQDPDFHDMLSEDGARDAYQYSEENAEEPSMKALHYRLALYLAAVLHNPNSRIMKPRLKRLFALLEEYYGDYLSSLSSVQYKTVKRYIEKL